MQELKAVLCYMYMSTETPVPTMPALPAPVPTMPALPAQVPTMPALPAQPMPVMPDALLASSAQNPAPTMPALTSKLTSTPAPTPAAATLAPAFDDAAPLYDTTLKVTAAPLVGTVAPSVTNAYFESPTATFSLFRQAWDEYTPFGSAPARAAVQGCDFGKRGSFYFVRDTDMVGPAFVHIALPYAPGVRWVDRVGFACIDTVQVRLGGTLVDTFDGGSLAMYHRMAGTEEQWESVTELSGMGLTGSVTQNVYVPLPGLLGGGAGCGFPLLACPNSPLQVTVGLKAASYLAAVGSPPSSGARVALAFETHLLHHLDAGELYSLPFTQTVEAFYTQTLGNYTWDADLDMVTSTSVTFDLSKCLGACKYLVWTCHPAGSPSPMQGRMLASAISLMVNGDTFTGAAAGVHSDPVTYGLLMPWQRLSRYDGGLYLMSFALQPTAPDATGETRLDLGASQLVVTFATGAGAVDVTLLVCCYAGVSFAQGTASLAFS